MKKLPLIIIVAIAVALSIYNYKSTSLLIYKISIYFFGYLLFLLLFSLFERYSIIKKALLVIGSPIIAMAALAPILSSASSILMALTVTALFSLTLSMSLLPLATGLDFSFSAEIYIGLTAFAIIATSLIDQIIRFYHYMHHKDYRKFSEDLALFTVNKSKVKFLIFAIYFIALAVINMSFYLDRPLFQDPKLSNAILQSFATYLAYDRVIANFSLLKK